MLSNIFELKLGCTYFVTFALKHRLWVLVYTTSTNHLGEVRWFKHVLTIYILSKNKKKEKQNKTNKKVLKIFIFYNSKRKLNIAFHVILMFHR